MMNPNRPVKDKFMSTTPRPREGLHDAGPPPFLTKTYDFVDDSATNHIVSWSRSNNSFVVWDPQAFAMSLLPKYFKHNNFSSFVRQLNTYGFRKVDPDRWEFANEGFLRGQKHLLRTIARRKSSSTSQAQSTTPHQQAVELDPCVEVGRFGLDVEIDRLRRDKQVLMQELVKLRQQEQNNRTCLRAMEKRLKKTETKQQHMMGFLARAMKNPNFVQQLVQQNDWRGELEEAIYKKRRRPIDQGPSNVGLDLGDSAGVGATFVKDEPHEYGDVSDYEVAGIDGMSMEMNVGNVEEEEQLLENLEEDEIGGKEEVEEEGFWENLLNENIEDEMGSLLNQEGEEEEEEENLDVLVEQLGYMGSDYPK